MFFAASDSDGGRQRPTDERLPKPLGFLSAVCTCQLRECFRQFRDPALLGQLTQKRDEFKNLPPSAKVGTNSTNRP